MKDNVIERLKMAVEDALTDGEPELAAKIQKMIDNGGDVQILDKKDVKEVKAVEEKRKKGLYTARKKAKKLQESLPPARPKVLAEKSVDGSLGSKGLSTKLGEKVAKAANKDSFLGGFDTIIG